MHVHDYYAVKINDYAISSAITNYCMSPKHYFSAKTMANYHHTIHEKCKIAVGKTKRRVIPPRIEPGTLSVLDSRDNHYTMESHTLMLTCSVILSSFTSLAICSLHTYTYLGTGSAFFDTVLGGGGGAGWVGAGYALAWGAWYGDFVDACPFLSAAALLPPPPPVMGNWRGTGDARGERGSRW